ncbi:MAG: glycerol-3-phosphate 1-O-acyltransferase PlsY [Akkermansia sp.]
MIENLCYVIAAYLIGSIPFGYLAGRLNGIDLREHGSCNIGATNAVRVLGKKWGIPVFICDFLKGNLPLAAMIAHLNGDITTLSTVDMAWVIAVMFALILGHTFTCFLGFKGGKGVATTGGCLIALSPLVGVVTIATWVISMICCRYVSLSSMLAGVGMLGSAFYVFIYQDHGASGGDWLVMGLLTAIFILVVIKHRTNIVRLMEGTEPKAFSKKK